MQPLPDVTRFFHPVLPARQLRNRPVQVKIAGRSYALFRDAANQPAALDDACPHRHAPLSSGVVERGRLTCPYHGWNFDGTGAGCSPSQPSLKCDTRWA
jgi:phenylpropionate dioxygenase-like ring-hydroxylating dioxygenase large terminal subunit